MTELEMLAAELAEAKEDHRPYSCTCVQLMKQIARHGKTLESSCEEHDWCVVDPVMGQVDELRTQLAAARAEVERLNDLVLSIAEDVITRTATAFDRRRGAGR